MVLYLHRITDPGFYHEGYLGRGGSGGIASVAAVLHGNVGETEGKSDHGGPQLLNAPHFSETLGAIPTCGVTLRICLETNAFLRGDARCSEGENWSPGPRLVLRASRPHGAQAAGGAHPSATLGQGPGFRESEHSLGAEQRIELESELPVQQVSLKA